jgi:hypothetical protein
MKSMSLIFLLPLSGCFYGIDMSVEGRHNSWVEYRQGLIGKDIYTYQCKVAYCGNKGVPAGVMYLGEIDLGNGVRERGFRDGRFDKNDPNRFPQCRFYFKYEASTGSITDFRFEESEIFACRTTGA